MTARARQTAAIVGILGALALPKKTPCLAPGASCEVVTRDGWTCTPTDLEPLGVYALEWMLGRDVGLRYRRWVDCD
ncbi:MAG TPA: hypothetical protein VHE35_27730 [Kofleriaceae bacterium]|nr:hypothetical protein [Kofleriaceae bacterium]